MAEAKPRQILAPIIRLLPGVFQSQPTASGTAIALLPLYTYAKLMVLFTIAGVAATRAQIVAQLTQVRVVLSGRELWVGTGAQFLAIQSFYSQTDTPTLVPGFLSLDFLRSWMAGAAERLSSVLGTDDQSTLQIEFSFGAGATINAAVAFGARFPTAEDTGITTRIMRVTPNIGAVGLSVFPDLPLPRTGDTLLALHIFPPVVANLTNVAYVADDIRYIDATPDALNRLYLEAQPPRSPQGANGMVSIDFTALTGSPDQGMPMESIGQHVLELTFTAAAPGSFPILCEFGSFIPAGR